MEFRGKSIQFWSSVGTGVAVGIIVILIMAISSKRYFSADRNFLPYHWQQANLSLKQTATYVNDETCYQSQKTQLACLSAVIHMAYRNNLEISLVGKLEPMSEFENQIKLILTEKDFLQKWQEHLKTNSLKVSFTSILEKLYKISLENKEQSVEQILAAGVNSYLSVAKDPHTYIVPLSYFSDVIMNSSPRQKNYGFNIGVEGEKILVKKVLQQSPASIAGLRSGDQILTISEKRIRDLADFELSALMLEGLSKDLELEVRRGDRILFIRLEPSTRELPAVTSQVYGDIKKLGVIQINKFSTGVCSLVADEVYKLKHQLVRGMMLDLRDNSGGAIDEAGCILSLFIGPDKEAFSMRFFANPGRKEVVYTAKMQIYNGPLIVMMNASSASASELLAGSLQYYKRAKVAGEVSFGKGSFQEGRAWDSNDKILLFETKGFYFLPNGETPQYVGIQPDVMIKQMKGLARSERESYVFPLLNPNQNLNLIQDKGLVEKRLGRGSNCLSLDHYKTKEQSGDRSLLEGLEILSCLKMSYAANSSN